MITYYTVESEEIDEKIAVPSKQSPGKRASLENEKKRKEQSPP